MLHFSDGVSLDTSGPLRAVCLDDGWYVLGDGMSIPCNSKEDAEQTIQSIMERRKKGNEANEEKT